ncbi:ImuA family protein [Erythrobacter crassostreae]|uniref:ImuA family protein n=1 Tax=Erythrobacter crassostreae TaxID=2828328 RepID=UPI002104AF02|nr:recA-like protein [Erythrobacter crassostrea]
MSDTQTSSGANALQSLSVPFQSKVTASTRLSADDIAALGKTREGRWQPGLTDQPLHSEIFASASDGSGAGLALALARDAIRVAGENSDPLTDAHDRRQVLWVQDTRSIQRSGRPYTHGLPAELRDRLIHVEAKAPEDALFALEEGLRCRDLVCVIGEIIGNPRALDFTASRRLSLTAEKHEVPLWLIRLDAAPELSSARMRWQASCAPSLRPLWNLNAPGTPAWKAELFRARSHAPGEWILSNDDGRLHTRKRYKAPVAANTQGLGDLVRPTVGRSLAAYARA